MADLWTILIPTVIGSAVVPVQIMMVILLLRSRGGLWSAAAFAAGMTALRGAATLVFAFIFEAESIAAGSTDEGGQSLVLSAILLVLGLLMLMLALRQILKDEDPDAPPPKWLKLIESITPTKAFLLGAGMLAIGAKNWVFMISGVKTIKDADISSGAAVVTYVLFVLLCQVLVVAPVVVYAVAGKRIDPALDSAATWLRDNNNILTIGVSLLFGAFFVYKGLAGIGVI